MLWGLVGAIAKLPVLTKAALLGAVLISTVAVAGLPVHDIWFDYVLFIVFSALIGGMPEPDTDLQGWRFFYTWIYRSGHLLVASATAYFMHKNKWSEISGKAEISK
jgi:hypothetical protein